MRWTVASNPKFKDHVREMLKNVIPREFLLVDHDDRVVVGSLNQTIITALQEEQSNYNSHSFCENIVYFGGRDNLTVLGKPYCPVKAVSSYYLSLRENGGNGPQIKKLVKISIKVYKEDYLKNSISLAKKIAVALGISQPSVKEDEQDVCKENDVTDERLSFGERSCGSEYVEIRTSVDVEEIFSKINKSAIFQDNASNISMHVRIAIAMWSDCPQDGDDAEHWVNQSATSLWFVNNRHKQEFIEEVKRSRCMGSNMFRFLSGFTKITSGESAAIASDDVAILWNLMTENSTCITYSKMDDQRTSDLQLICSGNSEVSPCAYNIESIKLFIMKKREELLAERQKILGTNIARGNRSKTVEILNGDIALIEKSFFETERNFVSIVQEVKREREALQQTEAEIKEISARKVLLKESEANINRQSVILRLGELTKERDELKSTLVEKQAHYEIEVKNESSNYTKLENIISEEIKSKESEIDTMRRKHQFEEEKLKQELQRNTSAVEEEMLNVNNASKRINAALQEKKAEEVARLDALKVRVERLRIDKSESDSKINSLENHISGITIEMDKIIGNVNLSSIEEEIGRCKASYEVANMEYSECMKQITSLKETKGRLVEQRGNQEAVLLSKIYINDQKVQDIFNSWRDMLCGRASELLFQEENNLRSAIQVEFQINHIFLKWNLKGSIWRMIIDKEAYKARHHQLLLEDKIRHRQEETSALNYKALRQDELMKDLSAKIKQAKTQKEKIKTDLVTSLAEIKEERARQEESLKDGCHTFPYLSAQRKDFEEKFDRLRLSITTPSTHSRAEERVSLLSNKQPIINQVEILSKRLKMLLGRVQSEIDRIGCSVVSLTEKKKHLQEESAMRVHVATDLVQRENDLALFYDELSNMTDEYTTKFDDAVSLHLEGIRKLIEKVTPMQILSDEEINNITAEKNAIEDGVLKARQDSDRLNGEIDKYMMRLRSDELNYAELKKVVCDIKCI